MLFTLFDPWAGPPNIPVKYRWIRLFYGLIIPMIKISYLWSITSPPRFPMWKFRDLALQLQADGLVHASPASGEAPFLRPVKALEEQVLLAHDQDHSMPCGPGRWDGGTESGWNWNSYDVWLFWPHENRVNHAQRWWIFAKTCWT